MFTGIVSDLGKLRSLEGREILRLEVETSYDLDTVDIGASVCCSGACLTVVEKGDGWFAFEASHETLAKTTMGAWQAGMVINLERALKVGDELGGHLVSGHVDGVGKVTRKEQDGESWRFNFEVPEDLSAFIAPKGSVVIDGVSLTVNEVEGNVFGVNIIPHTAAVTTFGSLKEGDRVNLEIDMLARYVQRLLERDRT
ncbi:riboflavin synthase [Pelagibius sp. Alg239-R121]|uniref:riboflavin synthase n=1 Tax=Pelagibius sp. Alg239-R121 TaxID=2993448 RepID=UPI0024A6A0D4|nr:riboflavin synthase [Pelagibius sp. Alg239-R121]